MPFEPLSSRLPDLAVAETRTISLPQGHVALGLPAADYGFCEMFCDERGCDCRRVFFAVMSSRSQTFEAVIAYGWESAAFYRKWFKFETTADDIEMLRGPVLNLGSPETRYSDGILKLFTAVLLPQKEYLERVKRHYRLFRATIDKPRSPLLRRRRCGG